MPVAGNCIMPSPKVCRSLWPVDHEKRKTELLKIRDMLDNRDSKRWNFDFKMETPKAGRYTWELVNPNSPDIPRAYELTNLSLTPMSRLNISSSSSSEAEDTTTHLVMDSPVSTDRPSTPVLSRKRSREQLEARQSLITEFFNQKKNVKRRKLEL